MRHGHPVELMKRNAPEIIEVTPERMEELLERAASGTLRHEDMELLRQIFASYAGFFRIVGDRNTTIARLRKLMFGATTETSQNVLGDANAGHAPDVSGDDTSDDSEGSEDDESTGPAPGHGRHGAEDYPGAEQVDVKHPKHSPGDTCPDCGQGTLYEKPPGVLVRFVGQAPLHARVAWHQAHSRPTMDNLRTWLQHQFDEKLVEPNSALGDAINYLLKRWEPLTLFLRKAGAPLDNNVCERALKKAILHRKNSMFYKSRNGARVGDMFMSLIHTCELNGANAFEYLNQLQLHAADVTKFPDRWLPWNYRETIRGVSDAA